MKVRTVRKHGNPFAPQYLKNPRRRYDVPQLVGRNLIAAGLVESVDEADGEG